MLRRHDHLLAIGGMCMMVSMNSIGLPALKALRAHAQLCIHGHRNGWGMLGRSPAIGMSFVAFQKFWRLAGIDHTHVNGLKNKFCEDDESVMASARACLTPMFPPPYAGCEIMPVFSSGQSARQAAGTYQALGSTDLIFAAGGGILGHPHGSRCRRAQPATGLGSSHGGHSGYRICSRTSRAWRCAGSVLQLIRMPLLYCYYGDDFTGSDRRPGAARCQRRIERPLSEHAGARATGALLRLPGHWFRRRCAIAHTGMDE